MSVCKGCGSQDTVYKEGVGKSGKPYRAYKCNQCQTMNWINAPKGTTYQKEAPNSDVATALSSILKDLQLIKKALKITQELTVEKDSTPF